MMQKMIMMTASILNTILFKVLLLFSIFQNFSPCDLQKLKFTLVLNDEVYFKGRDAPSYPCAQVGACHNSSFLKAVSFRENNTVFCRPKPDMFRLFLAETRFPYKKRT